ncbi:MAG TPA: VanW family protein [bacterium]|jgi:hypothetical protein|nr:VanW family protein [bacterium]
MSPPGIAKPLVTSAFSGKPRFGMFDRWLFRASVLVHQVRRTIENQGQNTPALQQRNRIGEFSHTVGESYTEIFGPRSEERVFELGKQRNLELAVRVLDGLVIPAGEVFSFWRQLGRPTKRRGFQVGREIRWGCLVPTVGGGLCQLSGALYECALKTGATIIETHRHTRQFAPGTYHSERDATVFWNYVDLRFRHSQDLYLEVSITEQNLKVVFRSKERASGKRLFADPGTASELAEDCLTCGKTECFNHSETRKIATEASSAFEERGQSSGYTRARLRFLKAAGAIDFRLRLRFGASVGAAALHRARIEAAWYRILFAHIRARLLLSQATAPLLLDWLQARGITYEIALEHLPLGLLQERLNFLASQYPEDRLVRDFRAPNSFVDDEAKAINSAASLTTTHPWLAELFPSAVFTDQFASRTQMRQSTGTRHLLVFPGPAMVREGVNEVLEVANRMGLKVVSPHASAKVVRGLDHVDVGELKWDEVFAYVHPCVFDQPNSLLNRALMEGVPIIGTLGVPYRGPLFTECGLGNVEDLESCLRGLTLQRGSND